MRTGINYVQICICKSTFKKMLRVQCLRAGNGFNLFLLSLPLTTQIGLPHTWPQQTLRWVPAGSWGSPPSKLTSGSRG